MAPETAIARKILRSVVRELGPPPRPVRFATVDRIPGPDAYAVAYARKDHFLIRLLRGLDEVVIDDAVIHELAHVYAWTAGAMYRGDHDEVWGIHYARIYCAANECH